jgi:hypothetical protein
MGLNPGRRGGKPATNRLSYGAALHFLKKKRKKKGRGRRGGGSGRVRRPENNLNILIHDTLSQRNIYKN